MTNLLAIVIVSANSFIVTLPTNAWCYNIDASTNLVDWMPFATNWDRTAYGDRFVGFDRNPGGVFFRAVQCD